MRGNSKNAEQKRLNYFIKSRVEGQLMLEAMVGLSVLTLASHSLSLNRVNSERLTANYLAMEGVEIVKNLVDGGTIRNDIQRPGFTIGRYEVDYKDRSLKSISGPSDTPLYLEGMTGFYGYSPQGGVPTRFYRTIQITQINENHLKINSIVNWNSRGGASFEVDIEDHFYNWR